MHLLGEYYDEREWLLNFHIPFYVIKKVDLMNASGYKATKGLKETMSSMYLNCAKYDRMFRQCINTFGPALLDDPFNLDHAECSNIKQSFEICIRNNQWYHETKKYFPEKFNAWKGKDWQGRGDSQYVSFDDI
jgi:hypothetical protein